MDLIRLKKKFNLYEINYYLIIFTIVIILNILKINIAFAKDSILVAPFENMSPYKAMSSYTTNTGSYNDPKRIFTIDRYSEIPRSLIEDAIVNIGGSVVERQRIDQLILESDFVTMSGLVESSKSIEVGKMLGASSVLQGTIVEIREKKTRFDGYGISKSIKKIISTLRVRVIDIESGKIIYSKTSEGSASLSSDNYSTEEGNEYVYDSIKNAINYIIEDKQFINLIEKGN
jgi:hypothetical protein